MLPITNSITCYSATFAFFKMISHLFSYLPCILHLILHKHQDIRTIVKCLFSSVQFSSVQSLSRVRLLVTPWIAVRQASLSIIISWSSLRLNVHRVHDAIQPSHPLSSPAPPAPNPSQHQGLFQWVSSSHEVAKVLEFQLYHHSFQRNPRSDLLQNGLVGSPSEWTSWISLKSKGLSRVFSNATDQKHQFFSTQLSL